MYKRRNISLLLIIALIFIFVASGCDALQKLTNKVPEKYIEGIKYDRDYPDDVLEIYDDAIVYESDKKFDEVVLTCGTSDDIDDVIDYYKDFLEDNDIIPDFEEEDRDEYQLHFYHNGYNFKIKVQEADGEYIEEVFENVILVSAEKLGPDKVLEIEATPTPTPAPTATPAPTPNADGLTPIETLSTSTWTLYYAIFNDTYPNIDITLNYYDETNGKMYYYDYKEDTRWWEPFTYEINDYTLTILYDDGSDFVSQVYVDNEDDLVLIQKGGWEYYFYNWYASNDIEKDNEFRAYGSWIFYDPYDGYMDTISFWNDGTGYVYNWNGNSETLYMEWTYSDNLVTITNEYNETSTIQLYQYGEIFELHINNNMYFYNRVNENYWLPGDFLMTSTSDETLESWELNLSKSESCYIKIIESDGEIVETTTQWFVGGLTGALFFDLGDDYVTYDYHYDPNNLILYDYDYEDFYVFTEIFDE